MEADQGAAAAAKLYNGDEFYKTGIKALSAAELIIRIEPDDNTAKIVGQVAAMLLIAIAKVEVLEGGGDGVSGTW